LRSHLKTSSPNGFRHSGSRLIAAFAIQLHANPTGSAFFGENPRTIRPRRIMPHMLPMSAFQIRNPVVFGILMEASDLLIH
jgi:hypothetical protein